MAFDAFLNITGIPGESRDRTHAGEIDVLSFKLGVTQPPTCPGPQPAPAPSVQDLSVVKLVDAATPLLFAAACSGERIDRATLTCRKAGDKPLDYLTLTLTDVFVSSVQPGGSAGGGTTLPMEEVTFTFGGIEVQYIPQDSKGKPGTPVKRFCGVGTGT